MGVHTLGAIAPQTPLQGPFTWSQSMRPPHPSAVAPQLFDAQGVGTQGPVPPVSVVLTPPVPVVLVPPVLFRLTQSPQAPLTHVQVAPVAVAHKDPAVEQAAPTSQRPLATPPVPVVLVPPVLFRLTQSPQAPLTHVQVAPVAVAHKDPGVEQAAPTSQRPFATPPDPVAAVAPVPVAPVPLAPVAPVLAAAEAPVPDPNRAPPALDPLMVESSELFAEEHAPSSKTKPETLAVLRLDIFVIPFKPKHRRVSCQDRSMDRNAAADQAIVYV
jgi:hypothetical protein